MKKDFNMKMEFPIFIVEGFDVSIHKTLKDAVSQLEVIDVKDKIYDGYDACGRRLDIDVIKGRIVISLMEEQPTRIITFEEILRNHLRSKAGSFDERRIMNLNDLVAQCVKYM